MSDGMMLFVPAFVPSPPLPMSQRWRACPVSAIATSRDAWLAPLLADEMLTSVRWEAAEQDLEDVDLDDDSMLTYGEFDLDGFHSILDVAVVASGKSTSELTFADLGSGAGRLVLSAAARSSWKACVTGWRISHWVSSRLYQRGPS